MTSIWHISSRLMCQAMSVAICALDCGLIKNYKLNQLTCQKFHGFGSYDCSQNTQLLSHIHLQEYYYQ